MGRPGVGCLCFAEVGQGGGGVRGAEGLCSWLSVSGSAERALPTDRLTCVLSVAASSPPVVYIWVTSKYPTGQGTIGSTEGSPIVL